MTHINSLSSRYAGSIAAAFSVAAKVTRSDVFGADNDRWLPKNYQDDAKLPFLGYVGASFRPGGVVLMAINPGGGSEKYKKTSEDKRLCPALERLRESSPQQAAIAAGDVFQNYIEVLPTWNLWRIVKPVLKATDTNIHSIAFLNVVPFRTKDDGKPNVNAVKASWNKIVSPLLAVLKPSQIIALGKKAGDVLQQYRTEDWELVTVPRTNGDSHISPEAQSVLEALSRARSASAQLSLGGERHQGEFMLAESKDASLYPYWLSNIESEQTRDAFRYLIGCGSTLKSLRCQPKQKGVVSAVQFIDAGRDEVPFAFIPNKQWLLFYFRAPAIRSNKYSFASLQAAFDSVAKNKSGEWTVKLRSIADVQRLWRLLSIE